MKAAPLLHLLLGIWIGGSVMMGAVATYNFAGFSDLFARNARLQERAGFAADDAGAKKRSLLWVHSSELNRVFFETWNRSQLVLGGLAVLLAVLARSPGLAVVLLSGVTALVAVNHLIFEPVMVELGRQLDFVPREPPPPALAEFQRHHGMYFAADSLRFVLLCLAATLVLVRGTRADPH
jgi:hypothetical protein